MFCGKRLAIAPSSSLFSLAVFAAGNRQLRALVNKSKFKHIVRGSTSFSPMNDALSSNGKKVPFYVAGLIKH